MINFWKLLEQIDEKSTVYFNYDGDKGMGMGDRCVV